MGCIYIYRNKINAKAYIGKCHTDVHRRHAEHIKGYGSRLLKRAFDKYGIENFTFEILYDGVFDELLDDYEIQAIAKYDTVSPRGYNLTFGGDGGVPSDETRQKMSESQKSRTPYTHSEETKRKLSDINKGENNPNYGKKPHNYGKKHSLETRRKMSESKKGRKGRKHSTETLRKIM